MRRLTSEEIEKFASRKGVKKIAVENFLATMGSNPMEAHMNMGADAKSYGWNAATQNAIRAGIELAKKP